jgi:DNA primase
MVISTGYKVKVNMDWANILEKLGMNVPIGTDQFSIICPFHQDKVESCSINTDKAVWICFAGCGQGHLKGFIRQYKGWSTYEVDQFLADNSTPSNLKDVLFEWEEEVEEELPIVDIPYTLGNVPRWIFDRAFNKRTLKKWNCGVTGQNGLVIPVNDRDSRTVGWITRQEKRIPKYLYSKGLKKSKVLFGQPLIPENTSALHITEGPLDAMWLDQLGFSAVSLLGMSMSKTQRDLILTLPVKEVILCLDNDQAGKIGRDKALDLLYGKITLSYIKLPKEYKDVQDVRSYDILNNIIKNRRYW